MAVKAQLVIHDEELQKRLKKLERATQKVKGYDVGFFKSATYPNGVFIAEVAEYNEFGTTRITKNGKVIKTPQRPFFSIANKTVAKQLVKLIDLRLSEENSYILSKRDVEQLGAVHQGAIQKSITDLKSPPNSPATIAKKGSTNPLIASERMRRSVTYKVIL